MMTMNGLEYPNKEVCDDESVPVSPIEGFPPHIQNELNKMMDEITRKEPEIAVAIMMAVRHIHKTYQDKYAKGQDVIDTKKMLYNKAHGDFLNIYQVNRYLQRYLTRDSAKSYLVKDIEKAIHYLIFELTRRIKMGDINEVEPKI